MRVRYFNVFVFTVSFTSSVLADSATIESNLKTIKAVGKEGTGNAAASLAVKSVVKEGVPALIPSLKAFSGSTSASKNWLRSTVASIVDQETAAGRALPAESLKVFIADRSNDPAARTVAYAIYKTVKAEDAKSLLPTFLDDASIELRREAIAAQLDSEKEKANLQKLFTATRDKDQAEQIAKMLEDQGTKVDLTSHFGYITAWNICGPFDSTAGAGFAKSFPAEAGFISSKSYPGKANQTVTWKTVSTAAKYGMVDLNKEIGKNMDAVAYATAQFTVDKAMPCEVRVGSKNAIHIYLNGTKLFEREAYHHGFDMDQHIGVGTLKAGENEVVLKVVQNNQKENWAQDWGFNLRICDATGGKLPLQMTTATEVKK